MTDEIGFPSFIKDPATLNAFYGYVSFELKLHGCMIFYQKLNNSLWLAYQAKCHLVCSVAATMFP